MEGTYRLIGGIGIVVAAFAVVIKGVCLHGRKPEGNVVELACDICVSMCSRRSAITFLERLKD